MTDADESLSNCPNCEAALQGRYCHSCGQDNLYRRLRARDVLARSADALADTDSTLWRTVLGLTKDPGGFARDYVEGRRAGRFPPFRYLIVTFAVSMILSRLVMTNLAPPIDESLPNAEVIEHAQQFVLDYLQIPYLLSIPAGALVLRLLYLDSGRNFAECCVVLAFTLGHVSIVGLLLLPVGRLDYLLWAVLGYLLQFGYLLYASQRFFASSWPLAFVKTFVLFIAYSLVAAGLSLIVLVVYLVAIRP